MADLDDAGHCWRDRATFVHIIFHIKMFNFEARLNFQREMRMFVPSPNS